MRSEQHRGGAGARKSKVYRSNEEPRAGRSVGEGQGGRPSGICTQEVHTSDH